MAQGSLKQAKQNKMWVPVVQWLSHLPNKVPGLVSHTFDAKTKGWVIIDGSVFVALPVSDLFESAYRLAYGGSKGMLFWNFTQLKI